ncbi:3-deoxy-7-phosphoheptulonate synthase [Nocardiopsis sp. RSe5-2]|uniref:Phospho-2-dehydro-3-deoxyheptonate aldolase n=1 Tax=Nocardiopsis endophytica TaxID=3018445 RepID=A0ABT4U7Z2_9ACTN|nr:3-deoxy-7-phosphoheptulonate synthase [Nocardiopsis endophytica]MDA2812569.1 3-deoxy-7-phosphoheptulonate synthase [Nocardiopsis endophytica]
MSAASLEVSAAPAAQQPRWEDAGQVERVREALAALPPLIDPASPNALRAALAEVASGRAQVVQAGDCAEDPAECTARDVDRKAGLLHLLAGTMEAVTGRPVVRAGRIAGQYAKPRSAHTETVGGVELPVYRGHLVNGPEPDPEARRPDPRRLLAGYRAANRVMANLATAPEVHTAPPVWTSHEALLLDYELPMVRRDRHGNRVLTSTHWPWIGDRTARPDGAHVALLADVANPVACKVGPRMTTAALLALCARLDPGRTPGRLTLIARMGADTVAEALPPLAEAVCAAGHPVVWLVDPMHGNTHTTADGRKTRLVETIVREVRAFQEAVRAVGATPGGVHLETTPDAVAECVDADGPRPGEDGSTTLCDPRLNPRQAASVVAAWQAPTLTDRVEGDTCRA